MVTEDPMPGWALRSDVIQAAIAYEEAWTAHFQGAGQPNQLGLISARTLAHSNLVKAVRALKERHG